MYPLFFFLFFYTTRLVFFLFVVPEKVQFRRQNCGRNTPTKSSKVVHYSEKVFAETNIYMMIDSVQFV